MDRSAWFVPVVVLSVIAVCACVGVALIGLAGGVVYLTYQSAPTVVAMISPVPVSTATPTPVVVRPTLPPNTPQPTETPTPVETTAAQVSPTTGTVVDGAAETLLSLQQALIPTADPIELAQRLQGLENFPRTLAAPSVAYQVGDELTFWVSDNNNQNVRVRATLQYITEHSYFWIETGVTYRDAELHQLAETFELEIYPTNREFFGSEWTPGVDSDPHIYILYARGIGDEIAGYFSSADEYPREVNQYSNSHEMFVFNADNSPLSDEYTYGVLAHEFQHMIHWYQDRNETSWLNEGFAELAVLLNGLYSSGFDWMYTADPDLQLNVWPDSEHEDTTPHYGAGFLFVTYFLDRFGEEATQALVAHQENDLESVDAILEQFNAVDPLTGQLITADDVFIDWAITNYLLDGSVGDGRYDYRSYHDTIAAEYTDSYTDCPVGQVTRDVHQYGVDYISFPCIGTYNIHFEGSVEINVVPENPYSGVYAFWSNKSDESDMTLDRTFDFTNQTGPLTLTYWTWYDIEEDWDYLYLSATIDGEHWEMLDTPSGVGSDPIGNNYGWGYTGTSGGNRNPTWIQETVDLSRFAGRTVTVRFEYITDSSVTGEGFLLDNVAVPEIGYFTDFEADNGGWEAAGWVRMQNRLPQTYRLALLSFGRSGTTVQYITMNPNVTADIPFTVGNGVDEVVLVVTATTRFTRQVAPYRFWVTAP